MEKVRLINYRLGLDLCLIFLIGDIRVELTVGFRY